MTALAAHAAEILAREGIEEAELRGRHHEMPPSGGLRTVSLAALIRDGVPPPDLLAGDLLYRKAVHIVAGEPDCGKTTLALWLALGLMRQGERILMLDEESGEELCAEKLISLGATEADAANLTYVPFPGREWSNGDILELRALVDDVQPAMVLFDSCAAFMARAGLDENAAMDVTSWWSRLLIPLARYCNAAVVVIDHDVKNGQGSRFSRGSGAKLAASDVMIKVEMVKPFTRTENGVLRLAVTKDRRGWLHRWWDVQVRTAQGLSLFLAKGESGDDQAPAPGSVKLAPADRKIESVLSDQPATQREITDRIVAQYGHGLTRETVSRSLNKLLKAGAADLLDQGPGRAQLWTIHHGLTCDEDGSEEANP